MLEETEGTSVKGKCMEVLTDCETYENTRVKHLDSIYNVASALRVALLERCAILQVVNRRCAMRRAAMGYVLVGGRKGIKAREEHWAVVAGTAAWQNEIQLKAR